MAGGTPPGPDRGADGRPLDALRPLEGYLDEIRAITGQGIVDVMLVSSSTLERLGKGTFESSQVAWERCSRTVRKLHARNVAILMGRNCDRPVDAVVCSTAGGLVAGETGMAIRIAEACC